jgi:hypothetical protein
MKYNHFDMLPEKAFERTLNGSIKPQGGGGQQSTPTQTNVTNTSIPDYAQPYVQGVLGQGQALTDINQNPYQPYQGQLLAGFSPLQTQAFSNISNQQVAPQITDASNLADTAGQGGINAFNTASQLQNQATSYGQQGQQSGLQGQQLGIQGGGQYGGMGAGYGALGASTGQQAAGLAGTDIGTGMAGMQSGMSYGQNAQNPNAVASYMNPYLQNALAPAQQLLNQQYGMAGAAEQGAATSAGAFGGSREALMQGLNQQNQNLASNQLVSNAYNQAYNTANQNMQQAATLGMQGAQTGLSGLNAANTAYGTGIQGANTGIQGANTGLQGVNTQLAGTAQGMQGAQTGISGVNAATNAGQYGLAGLGLTNSAANTLGQLGASQFSEQQGIDQSQLAAGAQQQQLEQQGLNTAYGQYQQQLQYPYQQLSFMQGLYSGLPMSNTAQSIYQNPSLISQAAGLGTAGIGALGLYNTMNKGS